MTAAPTCKPWCDDHQYDELSECYTRVCIFDDDEETKPAAVGHPLFQPLKEISRIFVSIMEDEEEDQPRVEIEFYEAGNITDPDGILHLDATGLKDLHAQLGAVLEGFH